MAVLDKELIFFEAEAVSADMTSKVVNVGPNGGMTKPLFVDVKLSEKLTSGSIDSVKVQSAADEAFTAPVDEMEIMVQHKDQQTKRPMQLVQAYLPLKPAYKYLRLVITGTTPAGGSIWAYLSPDVQLSL